MTTFHLTGLGRKFYEHDIPEIASQLKSIAHGIEESNKLKQRELKILENARALQALSNKEKATIYAEKHGIIGYLVVKDTMVYKEVLPTEGTYEVVVDLNTMCEVSRNQKEGELNA